MDKHSFTSPEVNKQTHRVIDETKKLGNEIYKDGKHKLDQIQDDFEAQSDKLVQKIHEKPIASMLWAAGIGFILAHLLRK